MFSTEYNGYNRSEVDKYIAKLKAEHEALLMEEKLKVLEAEKKVLDFKNKSYELENREKNIMSALDMFKKYQDEGNKKMENLRAIADELETIVGEDNWPFPTYGQMLFYV